MTKRKRVPSAARAAARTARSEAPAGPCARRRGELEADLKGLGCTAFLASNPASVRYLSGFSGEDSYLLLAGGRWTLLTDSRFTLQAERDCPDVAHHIRRGPMTAAIAETLGGRAAFARAGGALAVETDSLTVGQFERLAAALGRRRLRAVESPVAARRECKDEVEVAAVRRAVGIAQRAFRQLIAGGSAALVGRSEADIAGELDYLMRRGGAEASSFPTIVAAGSNSALPHHRPGSRRVKVGQAVLFDWGALAGGYCSDLTRVVFTGTIPPLMQKLYQLVLEAQQTAIRAVRAGLELREADAAARRVIEAAGYGDHFGHGLGHGIGLDIHEGPTVSARGADPLRAGNIITVEPGVYLPGVGGVRIEDDLLVTPEGAKVLSRLPKTLGSAVLP